MKYFFKEIYNYIRYDIPYGIKNLYTWFPIIWTDRNYDHSYIYKIFQFKIKQTRLLHDRNKRYVNSSKEVKKMKMCEILIERLLKDEYSEFLREKHNRKWGEPEYNWVPFEDIDENPFNINKKDLVSLEIKRDKILNEKDEEQSRKEYQLLIKKADKNRENDKKYLFSILSKRIDSWWD